MTNLRTIFASTIVATTIGLFHPSTAQAQYSNLSVNCGAGRTAVISQNDGGTRVNCVTARRSARAIEAPRKRSWQKSALIIGGSAGTGAGVGALVGGKKGALIGAALGGGSASIYEGAKRR